MGELRSTLTRASRWLQKAATSAPLALSRKRAGEGHYEGRADRAQTCHRSVAIAASACEVIFGLGLYLKDSRNNDHLWYFRMLPGSLRA
jgi:hypothetical protein